MLYLISNIYFDRDIDYGEGKKESEKSKKSIKDGKK